MVLINSTKDYKHRIKVFASFLTCFSGQVSDLKGHFVTQVAMGKAHTCVLTKNGEVWTFGVNNKGQCGRDTGAMSQGGKGNNRLSRCATI